MSSLTRQAQQTPEHDAQILADAAMLGQAFAQEVQVFASALATPDKWPKIWLSSERLHNLGPAWGSYLLGTKQVPPGMLKPLEKALAEFSLKSRKPPRGSAVVEWAQKKLPHVELLVQAVTWPDKKVEETHTEGAQTFKHGPFTVNNLVGKDPAMVLAALDDAAEAIRTSGIRGFDSVLYGTVNIVGKIGKANVLAFYDGNLDQVFLRILEGSRGQAKAFADRNMDPLRFRHTIIHELAHRFWHKTLTNAQKRAWAERHRAVERAESATRHSVRKNTIPFKEGDPIPELKFKGLPTVFSRADYDTVYLFTVENGEKSNLRMPFAAFAKHMQSIGLWEKSESAFPTAYSKTDPEEHFCDAIGLLAQKRLQGGHEEPLRQVLARVLA